MHDDIISHHYHFNKTFFALLENHYPIPMSKFSTTLIIFVPPQVGLRWGGVKKIFSLAPLAKLSLPPWRRPWSADLQYDFMALAHFVLFASVANRS